MTSYFMLDLAERVGLDLELDVYEPREFTSIGPTGCNHCGGIVSESLVQMLAAEGINLPPSVVQRGIESYAMHCEDGSADIHTPLDEMRIAAVHRGAGPRGCQGQRWDSFDGYMLGLAAGKGARTIHARVEKLEFEDGRPVVHARGRDPRSYDLLVGAVGINSNALKLFEGLGLGYRRPGDTRTFIGEIFLGSERVLKYLGAAMHVFLLRIPRLEFAALIPKGDFVTVCLLGESIDKKLVDQFLSAPQVRRLFPSDWVAGERSCHCSPRLQMRPPLKPFADRVVMVGDCSVSRLYKDGIGAAYRTAKATAVTAVFEGVAEPDFARRYWPTCRRIKRDNLYGHLIFQAVGLIRRVGFVTRGMLSMVDKEQGYPKGRPRIMSSVLWDSFTGSAPYRDIIARTLRPSFLLGLLAESCKALFAGRAREETS
jgi:hypothetical protein